MLRSPCGTPLTPPTTRPFWRVVVRHPLYGQPLTEQMTDAECDAYVDANAPPGWVRGHSVVQGRNAHGDRVLTCVLASHGFTSVSRPTVTLTPGD